MKLNRIEEYVRGWFVGNFTPSTYQGDFEVAFHIHKEGTNHAAHFHKGSTEINLIVSGIGVFKFLDSDKTVQKGDIITIDPYNVVGFTAITDCEIVVIKTKSILGDKYIV